MGTRSMKNYRYLLIFIVRVAWGKLLTITGVPTSKDGGCLFGSIRMAFFLLPATAVFAFHNSIKCSTIRRSLGVSQQTFGGGKRYSHHGFHDIEQKKRIPQYRTERFATI